MVRFAAGRSLLPAEPVRVPSAPNALVFFLLTVAVALAGGIRLTLLVERGMFGWSLPPRDVVRSWYPFG